MVVNLVQQYSHEKLVDQLRARKTISKEQVVRESMDSPVPHNAGCNADSRLVQNRADDSDIVATSTVMSLKCPLSTLRISVPCRSVLCTHNQCFDAASFIQLQEQAPTWTCPVCSKSTSFESLQIDQYVDDILRSTPSGVEQVVIEPSGQWSNPRRNGNFSAGGITPGTADDELVEVGQGTLPSSTPLQRTTTSSISTPAQSAGSLTTSPAVQSAIKRPASQVIDLTESDEDDASGSGEKPGKRRSSEVPLRGFALWRHLIDAGVISDEGTGCYRAGDRMR